MKLKSIQFSVAALAGASVLSVVVVLVLYALFAGARTQELVQQRTQGLLEKVINERLVALARAQVSQIQRELEYPLTVVHGLANSTRLLGEPGADGMPQLNASRDEISALLRSTRAEQPQAARHLHGLGTQCLRYRCRLRRATRQGLRPGRPLPALVVSRRRRQADRGGHGRQHR